MVETVAAGNPFEVLKVNGSLRPLLKTWIEFALDALNSLLLPTRYLKSTSSAPGWSYCRIAVWVPLGITSTD